MRGYEAYLKKYPSVSRNRAERLMSDGICFFLKGERCDLALLPRNSSTDELVGVDLQAEACDCNVYRSKKACPHIAAALGLVEKNGGSVPYTDPVSHVYACLERLKKIDESHGAWYSPLFMRDVRPFLGQIPKTEKPRFLLELGEYVQKKNALLTTDDFLNCYSAMRSGTSADSQIGHVLYENREKCMKAVAVLLKWSYECPFSERQKETILKEIASSNTLAKACLPDLAESYPEYFSREQLLEYYRQKDERYVSPYQLERLFRRLIDEEPPLYEDFLRLYNRSTLTEYMNIDPSLAEKLIQAGYGDQLGKMVKQMVSRMRGIDDYHRIRQVISHEQFLPAWRERQEQKERGWLNRIYDWEIEIDFLEDPEVDPEEYDLEDMGCDVLKSIQQTRPDMQEEINQIARKRYRRAMKEDNRKKMAEALMLLVRGGDAIAVKYASNWDTKNGNEEELLYLIAAGMRFECLGTLVPDLKKLEVPHASGQTE